VKRLTMLITSDGQWVLEDSAEFLAALGDPNPDYDAASFAVKNLGFIKFQVHDGSVVEIELHPRNVQLPALLAVQQQLLSSQVRLFRIKYLDTAWHSEIMTSATPTISRLSELCAREAAPPSSDRFLVEPQDYSQLFRQSENPLVFMLQKWRMSFGHFDPSVIPFAIKHQLLSRMVIVGVRPRVAEPVFRFIGDGHANWLDTNEHLHVIGEKLENLPDKDYGGWASEFYKSVASTGEPRYDYVTAAIQRRPDTYVTRYERLLLPWKTPSEEILVTLWSRGLSSPVIAPFAPDDTDSVVVRKLARSA
jgi:hypothetical protein